MENKQQEYVDTPERIDALRDMMETSLSFRASTYLRVFEYDTPAKLKAFIESDFPGTKRARMFGEKTKAEVRAFYEEFERLHPAENYPALSERETIEYNIRRNATYFNEENIRFILDYYDRTNHFPMFYMVSAYIENSTWRKLQIIREHIGLLGERKTKEQLMEKYQLSQSTIHDELYWVDHAIRRAANEIEKDIANDWGQYTLADDVLKKPLLSKEDFLPLYQSVKEAEHLRMDLECFIEICYYTLDLFGRVEQRGYYWLYTVDGVQLFNFDWFLQDFRKIPRKKSSEPFDLSEACRNTEYWRNEKVVRKAVPTVIEIAKQILWQLYHLPAKGNKIIMAKQ